MRNRKQILDALLEAVAAIPAKVDWNVCVLRSLGLVLLTDDRDESTLPLMEAVAVSFGEVVESGSEPNTASGRELAGVLVRPNSSDLAQAADGLRLAYLLAAGEGGSKGVW